MRIRRLEISGFKSFADRAVVVFGDGITGVVGPNGCGKSNIVDSIRWCMGEMSAKNLRGRAMHDVIFAGCESRGPLGMAEVTLTLLNDGNVPPQFAGFTEIAVTRRLHRDGTSEYLINKVPARLRDVTDLFLGTGVGTRAYSIIEQGRIGFIVSSRPEDRRSIIEEVAGITKFKARKKAAERRMEATEQNLARVRDIVGELERQLVSLRRQARKAERYKELKEEQRDLDLHLATFELLRLCATEKAQGAERERLDAVVSDLSARVAAVEAGQESEQVALLEEEQRLQAEQQRNAEADTQLASLERDLEHWRREHESVGTRAREAALDVQTATARLSAAESQRRELEEMLGTLDGHLGADHDQAATLAAAAGELQASLHAAMAELEELRRGALEHVHGAAQNRTVAESLDRQRGEVRSRMTQVESERAELLRRREVAAARQLQLTSARDESTLQLAEWRTRVQGFAAQLERTLAEVNAGEARVLALRGELTERRSRLESLRAIARRLEGYTDGVRTLLNAEAATADGERPQPAVEGVLGLVTDIIDVPPTYEKAIEAVLGTRLQSVLVTDHAAGARAIEYLKHHAGGRSAFIPATLHPTSAAAPLAAGTPGVVGAALDCVGVAAAHRALATHLLGDVTVVDRLDTALSIWSKNGQRQTLVTLEGEVLEPAGVLAGGSDDGTGLLAKRREVRELGEQVQQLSSALELAQSAQEQLEQVRLQLEVNIQQLEKDIHAAELEGVELDKDIEAVSAEVTRLDERLEVVGYETEQLGVDLAGLDRDQQSALAAALSAESRRQDVEAQIARMQTLVRERGEELAGRSAALTELRVAKAAREEKRVAARQTIERLHHDVAELEARIEKSRGLIADGDGQTADLSRRIREGEEQARGLARLATERHATLSAARAAYEAKRQEVAERERSLRGERQAVEAARDAAVQVKMELQRLDLERQRLADQIRERHDADLEKLAGDFHMRPLPGPEEEERRAELDRALKNIGPINLTAITECAEIEKRYEFLVRQRDDLQTALEALKRAIQRINRASRERFAEAFTAVNEMFQKVFPRLFRGGEARLELSDSEDLLEAGVEIIAQPPGKKLQSVSLLSGGEKALTATALVFAIFLVKPSPFCVLDEVDAPLDDVNVGRFNDMLRDISRMSQFIVITHNKLTMAEADRLYGITMEEPGLSKVVSVNLGEKQVAAA